MRARSLTRHGSQREGNDVSRLALAAGSVLRCGATLPSLRLDPPGGRVKDEGPVADASRLTEGG
ncbi:hypothetical protein V7x_25610 [Crateriforma conspicua]|uniref:Uncharacterized protein n=1 Tax=Crateriforma conspicua TaxID=2527996 RepID=A0A5C6FVJ5_9PLAN|nr:hypothetical protein V7x_25610 [Crateriforma conspicua]